MKAFLSITLCILLFILCDKTLASPLPEITLFVLRPFANSIKCVSDLKELSKLINFDLSLMMWVVALQSTIPFSLQDTVQGLVSKFTTKAKEFLLSFSLHLTKLVYFVFIDFFLCKILYCEYEIHSFHTTYFSFFFLYTGKTYGLFPTELTSQILFCLVVHINSDLFYIHVLILYILRSMVAYSPMVNFNVDILYKNL